MNRDEHGACWHFPCLSSNLFCKSCNFDRAWDDLRRCNNFEVVPTWKETSWRVVRCCSAYTLSKIHKDNESNLIYNSWIYVKYMNVQTVGVQYLWQVLGVLEKNTYFRLQILLCQFLCTCFVPSVPIVQFLQYILHSWYLLCSPTWLPRPTWHSCHAPVSRGSEHSWWLIRTG